MAVLDREVVVDDLVVELLVRLRALLPVAQVDTDAARQLRLDTILVDGAERVVDRGKDALDVGLRGEVSQRPTKRDWNP